jgi:hypothetical protein
VWIYFTPFVNVSPQGVSTSLENRAFRLSVWDTLAVDSFLVQTSQGMTIHYGDGLNHFRRYPLNNPIVVGPVFWVGLRQVDAVPVGIGFDRNLDVAPVYYESANGAFVPTANAGTLMIRPEFARQNNPSASSSPSALDVPRLRLYPNPGGPGGRTLSFEGPVKFKHARVAVYAANGLQVWASDWSQSSRALVIPYSVLDQAGIYLVHFQSQGDQGAGHQQTIRLVVE